MTTTGAPSFQVRSSAVKLFAEQHDSWPTQTRCYTSLAGRWSSLCRQDNTWTHLLPPSRLTARDLRACHPDVLDPLSFHHQRTRSCIDLDITDRSTDLQVEQNYTFY